MTFASDIKKFKKQQQDILEKTIRDIKVEVFKSVIEDTPAESGLARGNWQTTTGAPATGVNETLDPSGANTIASMESKLGTAQDTTYLTNNLPYIGALEFGDSNNAAAGMVRKTQARFQRIVAKAVQKNKRK